MQRGSQASMRGYQHTASCHQAAANAPRIAMLSRHKIDAMSWPCPFLRQVTAGVILLSMLVRRSSGSC